MLVSLLKRCGLLLLLVWPLAAQQIDYNTQIKNGPVLHGTGAPAGSCTAGNLYTDDSTGTAYGCNGGTWVAITGSSSVTSPVTSPNPFQINPDLILKGPNPHLDVRAYGVRAINGSVFNSNYVVTATCVSGNATVALGAAGSFVNGDGVDLYGCGAAHAMSTPAAPTVTVSLASAGTGTGYSVPAAAGGSTTTCYEIAARDKAQGYTASSSEVCVTGWPLGAGNIAITTSSRSNNVTTYNVASTGPLASGGAVCVSGTNDDLEFGGCFRVTAIGSGNFTVTTGYDSRYGAGTAATGGTAYYWVCNQLSLPSSGAGMWEYLIWAGASGAETKYGVSLPLTASTYEASALYWDDFGSTMMGTVNLPPFVPSSPPSVATSDSLVTTISSGAGTTSVVLTDAPGTSISSTMRFDNAPTIKAAGTAALASNGGGGRVYIPTVTSSSGIVYSYRTSSVLDLSAGSSPTLIVDQAGEMALGDTMLLNGYWRGDILGAMGGGTGCTPQFALATLPCFNTGAANPGIYLAGGELRGIAIVPSGGSYISVFDVNTSPHVFQNMTFGGTATPLAGVGYYYFAGAASGGFGFQMRDVAILGGTEPAFGDALTPALITKNTAEMSFDRVFMSGRPLFFEQSFCAGFSLDFHMKQEEQGGGLPMLMFYGLGCNPAGFVHVYDTIQDTIGAPLMVSFGGTNGLNVDVVGTGGPQVSQPLVSGASFETLRVWAMGGGTSLKHVGQNTPGTQLFTSAGYSFENTNRRIVGSTSSFGAGQIPNPSVAPTATITTIGCSTFPPAGDHTYKFNWVDTSGVAGGGLAAPIGPGGQTSVSPASGTVTTDGTTQCVTVAFPAAAPTGAAYWEAYRDGSYISFGGGQNNIPITTTSILDGTIFGSPAPPSINTSSMSLLAASGKVGGQIVPIPYLVTNLPTASSNPGMILYVTDSTAISVEGQTCVGSDSNGAIAISNGSAWKCF